MASLDPQQPQEPEARPVPRGVLITFGLAALLLAGALLFYAYGRFSGDRAREEPLLEAIPAFNATTTSGVAPVQINLDGLPEVGDPAPDFELSTLSGDTMRLSDHIGRPVILNFWATWCAPCLRELPAIDRFHRQYQSRGWQVVGLAVDSAAAVREFLTRVKVGFPIGLAGPGGIDLIARLGDTEGGLPFTVVIDSTGQLAERKLGETRFDDLVAWADKIR